jgi:UDP-3-O-[3-hydroxymyristoyl] N-acetylglucosamine deacetylase
MQGPLFLQKTLKAKAVFDGKGVHSGECAKIEVLPAAPDHGILFQRIDQPNLPPIPATWEYVLNTQFCTTIGTEQKNTVSTVEHLLAAFSGLGISNALVRVFSAEIPILDGSALPFAEVFQKVGVVDQKVPQKILQVLSPIEIKTDYGFTRLEPSDQQTMDLTLTLPRLSNKQFSFASPLSPKVFMEKIAAARTFGFYEDAEKLWEAGLAKGAGLDNTLVYGVDGRPMNPAGPRFPDEPVAHKALDVLGDFMLVGMPLLAAIKGHNTGHDMNFRLVSKLMSSPEKWQFKKI